MFSLSLRGSPPRNGRKRQNVRRPFLPPKSQIQARNLRVAYQTNADTRVAQFHLINYPSQKTFERPPRHADRPLAVQNHALWFSLFFSFPDSAPAVPVFPIPAPPPEFPPREGW